MLMLLFYVGQERFALDCELIVEIFPKVNLKVIQQESPYIAGLMNYGGIPVPVIDTVQLIENCPSGNSMHTRIVLFKYRSLESENYTGLICEKAISTIDVELSQFKTALKSTEKPYLGGIYTDGPNSIQYFDIYAFLKQLYPNEIINKAP
jgi:chemotaxis-related protein WspB